MSRLWSAPTDLMTYALPGVGQPGPNNFAYGTVLLVARFLSAPGWVSMIEFEKADGTVAGALMRDGGGNLGWSDGISFMRSSDAGTGAAPFTVGPEDGWCLCAMTHPDSAGSPQPITLHKVPLATGQRLSRTLVGTSLNTSALGNGRIKLGGDDDTNRSMLVAAAGALPSVVMSPEQIDAVAGALATGSVVGLATADGWVADDSDGFASNLVADRAHRSAIVGTADDPDDPPLWAYGAAAGPPAAPANLSPPAISGAATVGATASCSPGTWSASPAPSISYQWKRGGSPIPGATSSAYVLQADDAGAEVTCAVTASNASGSASAESNAVVPSAAPGSNYEADLMLRWRGEWISADRVARAGGSWR